MYNKLEPIYERGKYTALFYYSFSKYTPDEENLNSNIHFTRLSLDGIDRISEEKRTAFFNSCEFLLVCFCIYGNDLVVSSSTLHFNFHELFACVFVCYLVSPSIRSGGSER